jgi:hypothetical protein
LLFGDDCPENLETEIQKSLEREKIPVWDPTGYQNETFAQAYREQYLHKVKFPKKYTAVMQ